MIHLTAADYKVMPWANGKGTTTELYRHDDADGNLSYRLSVAMVTEDGPFSILPGIHRNLTVISGPGFDLVGDTTLRAEPLVPVAFDGGLALEALGVTAPSMDFNVMVAHSAPAPRVTVLQHGQHFAATAGETFCFAIAAATFADRTLAARDLLIRPTEATVLGGPVILVQLG